jgi:sugar lactone lactonase YvrE
MSSWKKGEKPEASMGKTGGTAKHQPQVVSVTPRAAIPGGEISIAGNGLAEDGRRRPLVRFGNQAGSLLLSSPSRLVVRVPEGVVSENLTVDTGSAVSPPAAIVVGVTFAENLHPVANPALDAAGNTFTTFSGSRGQKVPTSVFKIDRNKVTHPFLRDLMNATGLAFDREGYLYVSSRMDGAIYRVTPDGQQSLYAEGMGVATGIAFDREENLYVGDRTGTIFKINRDRQIFVFATIEPSLAAYHLAFGPDGHLYLTGPTTSSFDHVLRVSPAGGVGSFYRGLGRPQGLAFDREGNLYVAASLAGKRGVVRLTPSAQAELVISGYNIVGLAFSRQGSMILATNSSLVDVPMGIEGLPLLN